MALLEQIGQDLTEAIKSKDETKTSTLRILKSTIHNWQIAAHLQAKVPEDDQVIVLIQKEIKSRREALEMYKKGGREELAQKEKKEIAVLEKYLPQQMSEEEIRTLVKEVVAKTGASGPQDIGKIMGSIMADLKGRADGSLVAKIVKEELSE